MLFQKVLFLASELYVNILFERIDIRTLLNKSSESEQQPKIEVIRYSPVVENFLWEKIFRYTKLNFSESAWSQNLPKKKPLESPHG